MFLNLFKKLYSSNLSSTTTLRTFVYKEILYNFNAFIAKKIKKPSKTPLLTDDDNDSKFFKISKPKVTREFMRYIFHVKEDFLLSFFYNYTFFKKEWYIFYKRELSAHLMWLIYRNKPLYTPILFIYGIGLKLFKSINSKFYTPGVYNQKVQVNYKNIYWGFISVWNATKIWFFSLAIAIMAFYILLLKRSSVLPQTLFFWLALIMLLYWLISGFVFFVKKYQFSRFTSVIQRFWRRSYILFWLIESGLLLVFFYLMINSSQESFYMFDQGYFLKTHLFSWKLFLFKSILVVSLISFSYLLLLNLKWSTFNKNIVYLLGVTTLLIYFVWIEFYQIYWVSNFYANFSWLYDVEDTTWTLEFDGRRTRILNHYVMILFLLKFWHIIFIFACWLFFLLRSNELETITYPLYSFNFQNFIILFLMTWLFMYPWFKHTYHWLAEIPYYWFYVDNHISFYKILINDLYYFYINIIYNFLNYNINIFLSQVNFINWHLIDIHDDCNIFIKATIKNEILQILAI